MLILRFSNLKLHPSRDIISVNGHQSRHRKWYFFILFWKEGKKERAEATGAKKVKIRIVDNTPFYANTYKQNIYEYEHKIYCTVIIRYLSIISGAIMHKLFVCLCARENVHVEKTAHIHYPDLYFFYISQHRCHIQNDILVHTIGSWFFL
jgi:hypothetical protein